MNPKQKHVVPEMLAASIASEAGARARAMEALSDERPVHYRIVVGLLFFAIFAAGVISVRFDLLDLGLTVGFEIALLVGLVLGAEVLHLRRRVNALTYLLAERQRSLREA